MTSPIFIRLSNATAQKLKDLATHSGQTESFFIQQMVEESIDYLVAEHNILDRVEEIRGGGPTFSRAELEKLLGTGK